MAVLNSWQRIDRVLSGKPFGDGADGNATISSDPNIRATITGTAGQNTGTAGSTSFANGDVVLLHQTQGANAGKWEINRVSSGGGTTSLTFKKPLQYTYGTGAQIIKVPMYDVVSVNTHAITNWNGSIGGVEIIVGKTSISVNGVITANGGNGGNGIAGGMSTGGTGAGFAGGNGQSGINGYQAFSGAGTTGAQAQQFTPRGNGGGGGRNSSSATSGGGGGNVITGTNGSGSGNPGQGGTGIGSADLTTLVLGGGGGGGSKDSSTEGAGAGGAGGGIVILISEAITTTSGITANGGSGGSGTGGGPRPGGGGGAGGSILFICSTATLGSNVNTATGGAGGGGTATGGAGAVGAIAVHHSGTVTGTTNPTFTDVFDPTLKEKLGGGAFLLNFV